MLTITALSPRAVEIVAEGHFTAADVAPALDRMVQLLDEMPRLVILADVRGSPSIALSAVREELRRLPLLFRMIRQVDRVAIVADAGWVRALSRIESALIPGVHYEIYDREHAAHARAWALRQTGDPRPLSRRHDRAFFSSDTSLIAHRSRPGDTMIKAALTLAAALLAVPAAAQNEGPSVADFLTRVQAVIAAGPEAVGSPEMQWVRDQVQAAGRVVRARQAAERAAGTPPTLCIPEEAAASNDLITHLAALPVERRSMPLVEGFASYVRSKYPCPRP